MQGTGSLGFRRNDRSTCHVHMAASLLHAADFDATKKKCMAKKHALIGGRVPPFDSHCIISDKGYIDVITKDMYQQEGAL